MEYLTGILALQVPCECNGIGLWNLRKKDFLNSNLWDVRESKGSLFGKYGIEENKIVPYHEEIYNVANYVRVYLDLLADCKFNQLKGLFVEAINTSDCRAEIFRVAYQSIKKEKIWKRVNKFLTREFGNAWLSYRSDAEQASKIAADAIESYKKWENKREEEKENEDNEE